MLDDGCKGGGKSRKGNSVKQPRKPDRRKWHLKQDLEKETEWTQVFRQAEKQSTVETSEVVVWMTCSGKASRSKGRVDQSRR